MSFLANQNNKSDTSPARKPSAYCQFEIDIRKNILKICSNLQLIEENLAHLNRNFVSKRIIDTLHSKLKETFDIVLQTDQIFRDWTINLAGNPIEKQKRKFSFEKLYAHFQGEVKKVHSISDKVEFAATKYAEEQKREKFIPAESISSNNNNLEPDQNFNKNLFTESPSTASTIYGDYDWSDGGSQFLMENVCSSNNENLNLWEQETVLENQSLIQKQIAKERVDGITRIQQQVAAANQIFRDIADLVIEQEKPLESIEHNIEMTFESSNDAVFELKKMYANHKRQRNRWTIVVFVMLLFFGVIWMSHTVTFQSLFGVPEHENEINTSLIQQKPPNTLPPQ